MRRSAARHHRLGVLLAVVAAVVLGMSATAEAPERSGIPSNPFSGARLYVDPDSTAAREVARLAAGRPHDAELLRKIVEQPTADWLTDDIPASELAAVVSERLQRYVAAQALPVLVAYAIPHRDCGGFSAGGLPDAQAYLAWINALATGIGLQRAVVVLEPDALPLLDCLPTEQQRRERLDLLRSAAAMLSASRSVAVYLDAGHSRWQPADVMVDRLRRAGVNQIRGFSLNVANFNPTSQEVAYGEQLASQLGGAHYVVDTSRNGAGSDGTWCNPRGRALGAPPVTETGVPHADAFLWLKRPGESDGTCGRGDPPAGQWFLDYALALAARANW